MAFPGLRQDQLQKAVKSLLKYVGQQQDKSAELIAEDELLYLQLALKKTPVAHKTPNKPISIKLPHPLYSTEGNEICLFVKDHKGEGHKAAKKRLEKFAKNGGAAKVVGLSKLRTKYESHEAKRQLCSSYDLFLADNRILPSLPKLIGKGFFKKKKQPIPVDLRTKDWPGQITKACQCTYMFAPTGSCLNIRVARSSMAAEEAVANTLSVLKAAVEYIPKKWANVQGVYLKTADSVALPVYQTLPDQPTKIVV